MTTKLNFLQYTNGFRINHKTLYSQTFPGPHFGSWTTNLLKQSTSERDWSDISKYTEMRRLRFCLEFTMWSSTSLIMMYHAALTDYGNPTDTTTNPHLAYVFLNTRCSILPLVPFCPNFPCVVQQNIFFLHFKGYNLFNQTRPCKICLNCRWWST